MPFLTPNQQRQSTEGIMANLLDGRNCNSEGFCAKLLLRLTVHVLLIEQSDKWGANFPIRNPLQILEL